jgi:hypothetical protein
MYLFSTSVSYFCSPPRPRTIGQERHFAIALARDAGAAHPVEPDLRLLADAGLRHEGGSSVTSIAG